MILEKCFFLASVLGSGLIFSLLGVPAGGLIGALIAGIGYRLLTTRTPFNDSLSKLALALVGANIGLMMKTEFITVIFFYFFPLLICLGFTIMGGIWLGKLLYRFSPLDQVTSFFCCLPGGATEAIVVSRDFGADRNIVAAFHSARIVLFVMLTPVIVGWFMHTPVPRVAGSSYFHFDAMRIFAPFFIALLSLALSKTIKLPAGTLLFAMMIGFGVHFVVDMEGTSPLISLLGQGIIGGMIGQRFDRKTFSILKKIGPASLWVIGCLFLLSLITTYFFTLFTSMPYAVAFLSLVPAGAGEMASIALTLELDASFVTAVQVARLVAVSLLLVKMARKFAAPASRV